MRDKFEILDMYNNYKISQLDIFWKKQNIERKICHEPIALHDVLGK